MRDSALAVKQNRMTSIFVITTLLSIQSLRVLQGEVVDAGLPPEEEDDDDDAVEGELLLLRRLTVTSPETFVLLGVNVTVWVTLFFFFFFLFFFLSLLFLEYTCF